jgi:hypothetical protein
MKLKKIGAVAAVGIATTALAACGSATKTVTQTTAAPSASATTPTAQGTTATSATPTTTKGQAGKEYLAAIGPVNAVGAKFIQGANNWTDSTTDTQAEKAAQPLMQSLTNLRGQLLSLANSYPPASTDIKALVTAYAPVIGDLASLGSQTGFSAGDWGQQFASDLSKSHAASAIVRSDLGLPQLAS